MVDAANQYEVYHRKIGKNFGGHSNNGFKATAPFGRWFQRVASVSFRYFVPINHPLYNEIYIHK